MEKQLLSTRQKLLDTLGNGATWEPVSPVDFFYSDGSAVGSFGKLILPKRESLNYITVVYFFPSGDFWITGSLTPEEMKHIHNWIEAARSTEASSCEDS